MFNQAFVAGEAPQGDPAEPGDDITDDDTNTQPIPAAPAVDLVKTASAIDLTVAGPTDRADAGDQITYGFSIENTGNVTLDTVELDDALVGYSGFACNDADGILAPGETTTCSAVYTLTQADVDAGSVSNTATVYGNPPAGDPADRGDDASDTDGTTTTIPAAPDHSLVKTFDPNRVGVGELGAFTLVYTNTGNVTLSGISITDTVEPILDVQSVVISPVGACPDDDQTITCSVGALAPGDSVTVTVTYLAMPLADDLVPYAGQTSGANYVFYFENGYVLYGSTQEGTATLVDPAGVESEADVEGRNQDIYFNVPEGGDGFDLHLSCSEVFVGGWGEPGTGPVEGEDGPFSAEDPGWQIRGYEVLRFNVNGLFKDCGQVFAPFDVENEAEAEATPARGDLPTNPIKDFDTLQVVNLAPIEASRERVRRGDVEVQYFNTSFEDVEVDIIRIEWDDPAVLLESAIFQFRTVDQDLGLSGCDVTADGKCVLSASIETILPARSKDWLKLSFTNVGAPEGLTITFVTSTFSTLIHVFGVS